MAAAGGGNEAILAGVATILQQASSALTRLTASQPGPVLSQQLGSGGGIESLTSAVAALAQVAAAVGAGSGAGLGAGGSGGAVASGGHQVTLTPGDRFREPAQAAEPTMSSSEFCEMHGLESWVGECLDLLLPSQRAAVMNPEFNMTRARNPNGIVISRIKQAVPLDQRLGMWVQINNLSDGVVDRIRSLTPEQAEELLNTGFKIMNAENPSAVAMQRITNAIKNARNAAPSRSFQNHGGSGAPPWHSTGSSRGRDQWAGSSRSSDRSRTPAVRDQYYGGGGRRGRQGSDDMPVDIQQFMDNLGLEWWCGEVLKRLSLFQRQQIMKDMNNIGGVRNPSGVVMSKVKSVVDISELVSIFIDLNTIDQEVQEHLFALSPDQQAAVIGPGIYLQNIRNPTNAVRSRINNVMAGRDAVQRR